mmetsp:Transcript_52033/g.111273  ORF Transcript_52033/g.111273 Transcript_52033/m.111273 type:complete len:231 (-) Transcript_52033:363-1055(-)
MQELNVALRLLLLAVDEGAVGRAEVHQVGTHELRDARLAVVASLDLLCEPELQDCVLRRARGVVKRDVADAPLATQQVGAHPVYVVRLELLLAFEYVQPPMLARLHGIVRLAPLQCHAVHLVSSLSQLTRDLKVGLFFRRARTAGLTRFIVLERLQAPRVIAALVVAITATPGNTAPAVTKVCSCLLVDLLHRERKLVWLLMVARQYLHLHAVTHTYDVLDCIDALWREL